MATRSQIKFEGLLGNGRPGIYSISVRARGDASAKPYLFVGHTSARPFIERLGNNFKASLDPNIRDNRVYRGLYKFLGKRGLQDLLINADVIARFVMLNDFEVMEKYVIAQANAEDRWVILNAEIPPAAEVPDGAEEVAAYLLFRNDARPERPLTSTTSPL